MTTELNPRAAEAALKEYERLVGLRCPSVGAFFQALLKFKQIERQINAERMIPLIEFPAERQACNNKQRSGHHG